MNFYNIDAPMYFDFVSGNQDGQSDYFSFNPEEVVIKEEIASPDVYETASGYDKYRFNRRRSRSVGDVQRTGGTDMYELSNAMRIMTVSESCESLDIPLTTLLSSSESKENLCSKTSKTKTDAKYESMAELVHKFHRQTPKRFHTVTSRAHAIEVLQEINLNSYVKPKTPKLLTKSRTRPLNILSHEQRQELEYEEALKNKTKFKPYKRDYLNRAPSLPNVAKIPTTKFEPFNLSKPRRKNQTQKQENQITFKARSVPEDMLEGPVGLKPRPPPKITIPKTPNIKMPPKKTLPHKPGTPHTGVPNLSKPSATIVKPFSFEERNKQMMKRKEEFIQKFIEDEQKKQVTKARPMPRFESPTKIVSKIPTVKPKTPNFASNALREEAERRFKAKLEQEELEARSRSIFKARPATILEKKPFEPEHHHHPVEIQEFELSTQTRAMARQAFDEKMKQKEYEQQLKQKAAEEEQRKKEEAERMNIRKTLVCKAQPIRHYKPIVVKPSEKPVTTAVTPKVGFRK